MEGKKGVVFGKEHTAMTKGVFIILMLIHHALSDSCINLYNVSTIINDKKLISDIVSFSKICISGFAFLSAYGMTCGIKKVSQREYFNFLCRQLIKLEASVVFVYVFAVMYKNFIIKEPIRILYNKGNGFKFVYMFIDAIGMSTYFQTPEINITWWYLYFAILLIMTMPFLYIIYKKFRYLLLPTSIFLPMALSSLEVRAGVQSNYAMLLPVAMLGIAFAYEGWFEKIKFHKVGAKFTWRGVKVIISIAILKISFDIWTNVSSDFAYVFIPVIPYMIFEFVGEIPLLRTALKVIGENATNIFLTHTFIYYYWYSKIIYHSRKDWCIVLILLIMSVILSWMIELLKMVSGYNKLLKKVLIGIERH